MSPITAQQRALREFLGLDDAIAHLRRQRPSMRALEWLGITTLLLAGWWIIEAAWLSEASQNVGLLVAGVLLCAVAYNALMLMVHEAVHNLMGRPSRPLGFIAGAPLLIGVSAFRVLHMRHHRHLGGPGDPDHYGNYRLPSWLLHWMRLTVGFFVYLFAIPLLALRYGTPTERLRIAIEYGAIALVHVALWQVLAASWMIWGWLVPVVVAGYMTAIRGFAQHTLTVPGDPVANTRTMRVGPIVSRALLGENHHTEHHLWPDVPSYNLRAVHRIAWPRLPNRVSNRSYGWLVLRFVARTLRRDARPMGLEPSAAVARQEVACTSP